MNDQSDSSDMPVITDEMINDYIRKRNLRRVILIVAAIAIVAAGIAALFIVKANEAAEERRLAEEEAKFLKDNNLITYSGNKVIVASDLSAYLRNFGMYYDTFTVHGKRSDKVTDLKTFLNSDKCASSSAAWLGWLGTSEETKKIEINGFIKTGDADSCKLDNLYVKSFTFRNGILEKGDYKLDISNTTADEVLEYFDIEDSSVRHSNSSRIIRLKELDTDEYEAEFWYNDNSFGEDPVKLVYTHKNGE